MQDDCYRALLPKSQRTITLSETTYLVFPGGIYGTTHPEIEAILDTHNRPYEPKRNHWDGHGECLSETMLRWKEVNGKVCGHKDANGEGRPGEVLLGARIEWEYCKRDEEMAGLPRSFWLLKIK